MRTITQKLMMFMAALMCSVSMSVSAQVLNEGFEDTSFPPDDWSTIHVSGSVSWIRSTTKHSGTGSAYANYANAGHENYLVTPKLAPVAGDTLSFYVASQSYSGTTLTIEVSTTGAQASDFTTVLETYTTGSSGTIGTTTTSSWVEKRIALDDYVGQNIYIAFHVVDDNGSAIYMDDVTGVSLYVPSCVKPATLEVSDITTESATLSWTAGGTETQYQYVVVAAGATVDWTGVNVFSGTTVTLQGLNANTAYDFYVRSYCSESDQSDAKMISFKTACGVVGVPFTDNFETGIDCYTVGNVQSENASYIPSLNEDGYSTYSHSASHCLKLNAYYYESSYSPTNADSSYAVLPNISFGTEGIQGYRIRFYARKTTTSSYTSYSNHLLVGVMTNPADMSTFTLVEDVNVSTDSYNLYEVSFAGYNGIGTSIVLMGIVDPAATATTRYGAFYVDDITVDALPNCQKPTALNVSDITDASATLTWTAGGNETQWQYVLGDGSDWTNAVIVNQATVTLTGLTSNLTYDFTVRAYCSESEQSEARTISFRTNCGAVAVPYTEGFEDMETGSSSSAAPTCWNLLNANDGQYPYIYVNTSSSYVKSGSQSLYFVSSSSRYGYAILPAVNVPLNTLKIAFAHKEENASSSGLLNLGYMTDVNNEESFVSIVQYTRSTSWQNEETMLNTIPNEVASTARLAFRYGGASNNYYMGIDDIVIDVLPNCIKPANVTVTNITPNTAEINCVAGASETAWTVQYRISAEENWTIATASTTMPYTLSGLTANTAYEIQVAAVCSETENSDWTNTVSFRTACEVATLPYADDFENGIYCWTVGNMQSTSSSYIPSAYSGTSYSHNGTYCLRLHAYVYTSTYSSPTNADSAYAVLPVMNFGAEGISAHRLRFFARQNSTSASYNNHLYVGTLTDPADMSTFTLVQDVVVEGTTYQQYEVSFANYTGEGQYIVLLATINPESTASSRYGSFYVDDLMVDLIPNCLRPTDVTVSNITANGAEITCVAGASETAWAVRYKAAADEDWTVATTSTTMPYALTNLAANTAYQVEVAAVCSETETSEWTEPVNFRTACDVEAIPYTENFENGIYCWTVGNMQSESSSYIPSAYSGATYAHDGTYSLRLNAYKSSTNADSAYAIMPAMNYGVKGLSGHTLKFYARQSSTSTSYTSYYNQLMIGVVSDPADMSTFTLVRAEEVTGTTYTFHEVQLGSYAGEGQYIVLLAVTDPTATGTRYGSFYVDDLSVEPTPACQPLASITAVPARTKVEVTLNPKSGLELSAAYDLVCSATELDNEALEAAQKTVVTESPYTVTGLERATPYYIYVRANCGQEDGVSPWVSTTVTTKGLLGCDDILEIGNGTTDDYGPMCGYYGYERNGYIFTPEDGLTAGNIASIAWNYTSANSIPAKIYLKNTTETGFESTLVWNQLIADATLVYDNTVALATGWNTIEFNAPFMYTGDNLMVLVASNVGGSGGASAKANLTASENTTCHFYIRKDTSIDDDAAYSTFSTKSMDGKRHNVRFGQCYALDPCPAVTDMTVALEGDGTTAARINWTTADADYLSSYDVLLSTTEVTDFTEVTPTATIADPTATTYVFSNLTAETHYYMYLRANCQAAGHDEGMSDWVGVDTIMNSACAAPNTLTTEFIGLNAVKASWHLAYAEQDMAFRYILSTDELDAAGIAAATPVDVDSNVIEIENLNYDQLYYLYVASACGNSTSEYISTSFTTYAACAPVENLTAARVEHNRVQLTWTKNAFGTETSYEVGLVGVEDSEITVTDNTAMLIGLTPETQYTAYVKAICSETSESAIETVEFTTGAQPGNCLLVGTATTSDNMPVTNYNYAYTQMIYTADNFDVTGNIQSIQLKRSTYANVMNNMKVYIGTTDKNVFASSSDWVPEEALTLVYQGSFPAGTADAPDLDIPFSTPFAYDGSSNIVIAISNGHGDWHNIQNFYYTTTTATVLTNRSDDTDTYALHPGTASGQSPQAQRTNIEFCFEPSTCPNVTALAISNVTSTSATATWEPMGSETSWNVYLSTTEVADMSSIVGTPVSAMSYPMSNLLVDQDYWFYVQPACATNTWKVATFRTVATCFPPMGLSARDITSTTAVVCWQDTNAVGNYTVLYGPAATFDLEEPASYETMPAADSSLQLTDLLPYTTYAFVVRCNCDDMSSRYSTAATFKTGAGIPFEPIFETTTLPTDWKRYDGLFNADTILTSALTTSSKWSLTTATDAINSVHFKANIYGTGTYGWVVTPKIDLTNVAEGTGMILRFDAALCKYGNPSTAPIAQDTDDKFAVIISRDGGLTWTKANMTLWQNAEGADYNYYEVPVTGKTYCIDMTQYAGLNIAIAFYGESTVSGPDNDFHFGNISLNYGTYTVYEETACQGDGFPKHGFDEASSEEAGAFTFERYTPATETALQQYEVFNLTVNPALNGYIELDVLYVGDHYVDQYVDTIVQLADMEEGYYGFDAGPTALGCDSFWYVIFTEIREATYIHEDSVLAEGESFIWHGQTIEATGMYYDTVRTELGGVMAYYELTVTAPAPAPQGKTFELVTTQLADWTGNYLIVFADNKAHATVSGGKNKDLAATSDVLTISEDNKIVTADSCFVTVTAMGNDGYSILLPSGLYLNEPNANSVAESANAQAMTLTYNTDMAGVEISGGNRILYCNTNNGTFYRMYTDKTGNSGYALPQLYKEVSGEGPGTKVETINAEDGAVKVILNGNLYIIRDNQWYDATGRLTVDPRK